MPLKKISVLGNTIVALKPIPTTPLALKTPTNFELTYAYPDQTLFPTVERKD